MRALLALGLLAAPAWAETPLTGAEFAEFSQGKVWAYSAGGTIFGYERYLPGQKVIWESTDGSCLEGFWRETVDGHLCFSYQVDPFNLQCGRFHADGTGMRLQRLGESISEAQRRADPTDRPMQCQGPEAGA